MSSVVQNIIDAQNSNITGEWMPNLKTAFEKLYKTKTKKYHYVWYVFPYNVDSKKNQFKLKYPKDLRTFHEYGLLTNLIKASLLILLVSIEENKTLHEITINDDDLKIMNCFLLFYLFYYEFNDVNWIDGNVYKLFEHFIYIAYKNQEQRYKDRVFKPYLDNEEPIKIPFDIKKNNYYIFNDIIDTYDETKMRTLYNNARNLIYKITKSDKLILKHFKYKGKKDFTDSLTKLHGDISGFLLDNNNFKNSKNIFYFSTNHGYFWDLIKTKIDICNAVSEEKKKYIQLSDYEYTNNEEDLPIKYCFEQII